MKKPLFNAIDRMIIREDKSYYATRLKLTIATKRFEKEFLKTGVGKFLIKAVELLASCKWVK